jgi:lipopolysaccharide export system permease protein
MTILNRYLVKSNLFLLTVILLLGAAIYILTDFFLHIDVFLESDLSTLSVLLYFVFKLPVIIAQILPPVFLLTLVLQLSIMTKHRETLALQAGGISFSSMIKFVFVYGLIWVCLQFAFAQMLGVEGNRRANVIWLTDAQGKNPINFSIENLWFNNKQYVIHMKTAWPNQEKAVGVVIYELSINKNRIISKIYADSVDTGTKNWVMDNVKIIYPDSYTFVEHKTYILAMNHPLIGFNTLDRKNRTVAEMNILELDTYIDNMKNSGTNVEVIRTDFHNRFAYAASLFIMGIIALAITMHIESIYLAILLSITSTVFYFGFSSFFITFGEKGLLDPVLAAWLSNGMFFVVFGSMLCISILRSISRRKLFQ